MTVRPPEGAITVRHTQLAPDTQQRRAVGPRPSLSRPSVKRTGSSVWCRGQAARASGSQHLFSNPGPTIQRLRGLGKVTQTLLAQCSGLQRWDNQHPTLKTKTKTKHPAGERAGRAAGGAPCAGTPPQARLPRPLSPSHAPLPPALLPLPPEPARPSRSPRLLRPSSALHSKRSRTSWLQTTRFIVSRFLWSRASTRRLVQCRASPGAGGRIPTAGSGRPRPGPRGVGRTRSLPVVGLKPPFSRGRSPQAPALYDPSLGPSHSQALYLEPLT